MIISDHATHELRFVMGLIAGGGGIRFLVYVSKALPALPKDAGWWQQLFYNLIKGASGLDPSATIQAPNDPGKR